MKDCIFLIVEVNTPAITNIKPCPNANKNSIITAKGIFSDTEANAIIPAKIGVEQGVPASANTIPIKNGYKNEYPPLFFGIDFTITGNSKSRISSNFNPIMIKKEPIISPK